MTRRLGWLAGLILAMGTCLQAGEVLITVDTSRQHQVIHGFGTCIVDWMPEVYRDLYMNEAFQNRYLEDLGHQMARIPIDPQVLPGEVLDPTAITWKEYKFSDEAPRIRRPQYAVGWAQALHKRAPDTLKVFGSVWSPPHWMKEGATLSGANSCGGRLRPDRYEHFARYLAQWIIGLREKYGVPLYAVSIQNELFFREPYNSCIYKPEEFGEVVKQVARVFKELHIDTKIMGPEDMTDQVNRFMGYVNAVERDPEAAAALDIFCSHGYYGGTISAGTRVENASLWNRIKEFDRELWMTETGGGSGGWDDLPGKADAKGKVHPHPGALNGLAAMIHNALVYGNVSVWTLWQITDKNPDASSALMIGDKPTKKYFVTKHYSRFIRDGARRVEAGPDGEGGVFVSAYAHEANGTITIVVQNRGGEDAALRLEVKSPRQPGVYDVYRSSKEEDCVPLTPVRAEGGIVTVTLPARSMVTLLGSARN